MTLRRPLEQRVGVLFFAVLFLGFAAATLSQVVASVDSALATRIFAGLVGVAVAWLGGWLGWETLRPFRFHIGPQGLDIRHRGVRRTLGWHEIEAVVLQDAPSRVSGPPPTRLVLVPAAAVDVGKPLKDASPLDGRPARVVLSLGDVTAHPEDVAEALSRFGGARFHNVSRRVGVDLDGIVLHRIGAGEEGARTLRWLRRRGTVVFLAWYGLLVLPALVVVRVVAGLNDGVGALTVLAASAAIWVVGFRLFNAQNTGRSLVEQVARVRGTSLVTGVDEGAREHDMHAGRARVLPAGPRWRLGRLPSLAFDRPGHRPWQGLSLADPRTRQLICRDDLTVLARVLTASPWPQDQQAGGVLATLAATAAPADTPAPRGRPRHETSLWQALQGLSRVLRWLVVVVTFAVAGGAGWPYDQDSVVGVTGTLLIGMAALLLGTWLLYLFYQLSQLLAAIDGAVRRSARPHAAE